VVTLPFIAARVTVDGVAHDLSPATDVAKLDVPVDARTTHRVVATALDGSLSEADVREEDGVGRALGSGFVLLPARASSSTASPPATRKVGSVRNGFTKLP